MGTLNRTTGLVLANGMRDALRRRRSADKRAEQTAIDNELVGLLDQTVDRMNDLVESNNSLDQALSRMRGERSEVANDVQNYKALAIRFQNIGQLAQKAEATTVEEKRAINLRAVAIMEIAFFCHTWDFDFQVWYHNKIGAGKETGQFANPTRFEVDEVLELNSLYLDVKCAPRDEAFENRNQWVRERIKKYQSMDLVYKTVDSPYPEDDRFGMIPSERFYDAIPDAERQHYHLHSPKIRNVLNVMGNERQLKR